MYNCNLVPTEGLDNIVLMVLTFAMNWFSMKKSLQITYFYAILHSNRVTLSANGIMTNQSVTANSTAWNTESIQDSYQLIWRNNCFAINFLKLVDMMKLVLIIVIVHFINAIWSLPTAMMKLLNNNIVWNSNLHLFSAHT